MCLFTKLCLQLMKHKESLKDAENLVRNTVYILKLEKSRNVTSEGVDATSDAAQLKQTQKT